MALLLPTRNPLAYPAGVAPGFDPTHVAAKNTLISGIAVGNTYVNLLTGKTPTISGTPVFNVYFLVFNIFAYLEIKIKFL